MAAQLGKQLLELTPRQRIASAGHSLTAQHDYIKGSQRLTRRAKHFAYQPFAAVTVDRASDRLAPRDDTEPSASRSVGLRLHEKARACNLTATAQHGGKLFRPGQAPQAYRACQTEAADSRSDREPRAALCPPCPHDSTPAPRFHAHAKPVGALAPRFGGLIGSLHLTTPLIYRGEKPVITTFFRRVCQIALTLLRDMPRAGIVVDNYSYCG